MTAVDQYIKNTESFTEVTIKKLTTIMPNRRYTGFYPDAIFEIIQYPYRITVISDGNFYAVVKDRDSGRKLGNIGANIGDICCSIDEFFADDSQIKAAIEKKKDRKYDVTVLTPPALQINVRNTVDAGDDGYEYFETNDILNGLKRAVSILDQMTGSGRTECKNGNQKRDSIKDITEIYRG